MFKILNKYEKSFPEFQQKQTIADWEMKKKKLKIKIMKDMNKNLLATRSWAVEPLSSRMQSQIAARKLANLRTTFYFIDF